MIYKVTYDSDLFEEFDSIDSFINKIHFIKRIEFNGYILESEQIKKNLK